MAWIIKMFFSIIIDIIDFALEAAGVTGVGMPFAMAWNVIQLILLMIMWPTGGTLVMAAIDFFPVASGFFPAATISGLISGSTGMD